MNFVLTLLTWATFVLAAIQPIGPPTKYKGKDYLVQYAVQEIENLYNSTRLDSCAKCMGALALGKTIDPSQLNGISSDTQSIRFGSMLLSKAYENYREVFQQRQQQLMMLQQQILQQQQQQQMRNRQQSHPPGDPGAGIGGGHGAGGGAGGSRNNSPAPGANGPQSKMHNGAPMGYNKQGMTPSQHQQYQAMQQQQQQQQRKMGVAPMNAASAAAAMAAQPRRASGSPDSQRFNGLPNGGAMANGVLSNGMGQRMMPGGDMKQKSELAKVDA